LNELPTVNALVIGYGSVGARHARLLREIGCGVAVVSQRSVDFSTVYLDLGRALDAHRPDYVVVANATDRHHETLLQLAQAGFNGTVLVEKPLFDRMLPIPENAFRSACVAYNLRFHPVVTRLKSLLEGEQILSVQAYVGQYLPDWRPGTDYRKSYSASAQRGGGVLLDLSHDLDYLCWMLGGWNSVAALGGRLGPLEITSEDVFALLMSTPRCPVVTIQLNYLDRRARRNIIVNTSRHTIEADIIRGIIAIDRSDEPIPSERDASYRAMHEALLTGQTETACSIPEALQTLHLIEAVRLAAEKKQWTNQ
jgi:predicted dehydrogenase